MHNYGELNMQLKKKKKFGLILPAKKRLMQCVILPTQ